MKIKGIVTAGKRLGRTIGFPTANILPDTPSMHLPENGVYTALITIEGYPSPFRCMLNQGSHPTAPEGPPTIEANILDFADDIYGLRAELEIFTFLRPERRFGSLEELKAQLARDRDTTRAYFDPPTQSPSEGTAD